MAYYRQQGAIPKTRHTLFRADSGEIYYEELMGEEGFSSDSSLLYHRHHSVRDRRRPRLGSAGPDPDPERPAAPPAPETA